MTKRGKSRVPRDAERLLWIRAKHQREKKPASLAVAGLNPIQGELEETGIIIRLCREFVCFIIRIADIRKIYILLIHDNKKPAALIAGGLVSPVHPEVDFF